MIRPVASRAMGTTASKSVQAGKRRKNAGGLGTDAAARRDGNVPPTKAVATWVVNSRRFMLGAAGWVQLRANAHGLPSLRGRSELQFGDQNVPFIPMYHVGP